MTSEAWRPTAHCRNAGDTRSVAEGGARELRHARMLPPSPPICAASQKEVCIHLCVFVLVRTKPVGCILGKREGSIKGSLRGMGTEDHGPGAMVSHMVSF